MISQFVHQLTTKMQVTYLTSVLPCFLFIFSLYFACGSAQAITVTPPPSPSTMSMSGRSIDIFKPFVKNKVVNIEALSLAPFNETDRPNILQKLSIFSRIKRKNNNNNINNKEQDPMMASDSIPTPRFSPFVFPPPTSPAMNPMSAPRPPFPPFLAGAASNRAMSYFNPFLLGPLDPYAAIARRMATVTPRPAFPVMPSGQIPTYFPLGSMMGTPIMDPNLGAALASTLSQRYAPNPLPLVGGPSLYGSSLYDDPYDSSLIASALKRYFKNGRGRGNKGRDEMRMPSEYSFDKFEYGYTAPRYDGYTRKASNKYREPDFKFKDYDYSPSPSKMSDDVPPVRESLPHSESNDEHRTYDSRGSSSSDSIVPPPPPATVPRYRDRNGPKDSTESYVDMYGWRGSPRPISDSNRNSDMDDVRREDGRSGGDRYNHESSPPYGSRSNSIPSPPPSTYKDTVNRSDLEAVSSDTNEKGRSLF